MLVGVSVLRKSHVYMCMCICVCVQIREDKMNSRMSMLVGVSVLRESHVCVCVCIYTCICRYTPINWYVYAFVCVYNCTHVHANV
jgi:hypothetical protein